METAVTDEELNTRAEECAREALRRHYPAFSNMTVKYVGTKAARLAFQYRRPETLEDRLEREANAICQRWWARGLSLKEEKPSTTPSVEATP